MSKFITAWSVFVPQETGSELQKTLDSTWLNTGKKEQEFREKIKRHFRAKYAVACNSGTSALKMALSTAGVGHGDEVVSTPYTFLATNTSILEVGAKPIFADIEYETLNISPQSIREKITKKTKAIMIVHFGGSPANLNEIRKIGAEFNLPIIEDSAHAMGAKYDGKYIGETGDLVTFSFQVIKIVTCGDGGVVTTQREDYYKSLKEYSWFGVDRESRIMSGLDPLPEDITKIGYKANMNDIVATMGCVAMDHLEERLFYRQFVGNTYRQNLADLNKLRLLEYPVLNHPNYQIFPVHIADREYFVKYMKEHDIQVIVNNRRNDKYTIFGGIQKDLINTAKADLDTILLPCHSGVSVDDLSKIIETIRKYDKL